MPPIPTLPPISPFTLGTVQLGLPYGIANQAGQPDESQSFAILRAALEEGVTVLDTAARYGVSETVIGRFLASERPTPAPVVVTKLAGDLSAGMPADAIAGQLREQARQSLDRLGLDRLPICLLHQPDDLMRHPAAVAGTFQALVDDGQVGVAGISVYRPDEAETLLRHGSLRAIQIPINLFDQRWRRSGTLARLADRGITVFARSIYLQGLFFMSPDAVANRIPEAVMPLRQLRALAEEARLDIATLALTYIRDMPEIDSLVIGCETEQQVRDNAALLRTSALDPAIRRRADTLFEDLPESLLNPAMWGKE